jgi:hypothetical protein
MIIFRDCLKESEATAGAVPRVNHRFTFLRQSRVNLYQSEPEVRIVALARKVDRLVREKKMVDAETHVSTLSIEGDTRPLGRSNNSRSVTPPGEDITAGNDAIAAGAASIADIEGLMVELQVARDYLQAEGERVRRANANYARLAQTASASARVIADSIGKWHIPEQASGQPSSKGPTEVSQLGDVPIGPSAPALEKIEQQTTQSDDDAPRVFPDGRLMTPEPC